MRENEPGIINQTIKKLTAIIYDNSTYKTYNSIYKRCLMYGIPVKSYYTKERMFFVLTQIIVDLIDDLIINQREEKKQTELKKKIISNLKSQEGKYIDIGREMYNQSLRCSSGYLNIATLIFSAFCSKKTIWDILDILTELKQELQSRQNILQKIKMENRIFYPPNINGKHRCFCEEQVSIAEKQVFRCSQCLNQFHPNCQSSHLYCNSCFLRFCVANLSDEIQNPFGTNKETEPLYFGYMKVLQYQNFPISQTQNIQSQVYFQVIRFDAPSFTEFSSKKQSLLIKIASTQNILNKQLNLESKINARFKSKNLKLNNVSYWTYKDTQYQFYLNHNPLINFITISKNCIIIKILPRFLNQKTNILVIKCIKYESKIESKDKLLQKYWTEQKLGSENLMVGIFKLTKIKSIKSYGANHYQSSKSLVCNDTLSVQNSLKNISYILTHINNAHFKIVSLIDPISKKKIVQPVRSYGCNHIQCFDYQVFKQKIKKKNEKKIQLNKINSETQIINLVKDDIFLSQNDFQNVDAQNQPIEIQSSSLILIGPPIKSNEPKTIKQGDSNISARKMIRNRKKIKRNKESEKFYCPICEKRLLILYIDPIFKEIISGSENSQTVRINSNGTYEFESSYSAIRRAMTNIILCE